jgi:hypothetical protein
MRHVMMALLGLASYSGAVSAHSLVAQRLSATVAQKPTLVDGMRVAPSRAPAARHRYRQSWNAYPSGKYLYPPTYNFEGQSYFYFPRDAGRKDEPTRLVAQESRWD